jgi:hypothetical protein
VKTIAPKTRHKIEQLRIDDEQGIEMWNLKAFAKECGHLLNPIFPIFIVLVDGTLSAFYYAQPHVCIYPTVHPNLLTPRGFYEVAKVIVDASKMTFGNPVWLVDSETGLSPEMLRKVHLEAAPLAAYIVPD